MNEIIINRDGTRSICGELAHALAGSSVWQDIARGIESASFYVYEGNVLRAAQSTIKGAWSYMSPDRVLVYRHE